MMGKTILRGDPCDIFIFLETPLFPKCVLRLRSLHLDFVNTMSHPSSAYSLVC